jgi:hypothetical protein
MSVYEYCPPRVNSPVPNPFLLKKKISEENKRHSILKVTDLFEDQIEIDKIRSRNFCGFWTNL